MHQSETRIDPPCEPSWPDRDAGYVGSRGWKHRYQGSVASDPADHRAGGLFRHPAGVFANFELYATEANLPRQGLGDFTIALDIPEHALDAARQDLLDIAVAGSDRIWQTTADGRAAAIFEVICDILDEGLAPVEQQALLDANLADLAS